MDYIAYGETVIIALKAMWAYIKSRNTSEDPTVYTNDADQNFIFLQDDGLYMCEFQVINEVVAASLRKLESPVDAALYGGPISRGMWFASMTF